MISELPREEMEMLWLTMKPYNCVQAAKKSPPSGSSLALFLTWEEFMYRNESTNWFPRDTDWWLLHHKGLFNMYIWGEMELDDF